MKTSNGLIQSRRVGQSFIVVLQRVPSSHYVLTQESSIDSTGQLVIVAYENKNPALAALVNSSLLHTKTSIQHWQHWSTLHRCIRVQDRELVALVYVALLYTNTLGSSIVFTVIITNYLMAMESWHGFHRSKYDIYIFSCFGLRAASLRVVYCITFTNCNTSYSSIINC